MADERLRELERRWQESGDPAHEARYLRAAMRAGRLPRERVEQAAHLGYAPANAALERSPPEQEDLPAWGARIPGWGPEACARLLVALARAVVPWVDRFDGPDGRLQAVLQAIEAWVRQPGPAATTRVQLARELLAEVSEQRWEAGSFCNLVDCLCALVLEPEGLARHVADALVEAQRQRTPRQLFAELREDMIPWLLARGDPLGARLVEWGEWLAHEEGIVRRLVFLPDGGLLTSSGQGRLSRWALDEASPALRTGSLEGERYDLYAACASGDGRYAISGNLHGDAQVWDLASALRLGPLGDEAQAQARRSVGDAAFLSDGARALLACGDGTIQLWDVERRALLRHFEGHERGVTALSVAAEGERFLSGSHDGTARLWTAFADEALRIWRGEGSVADVRLLPHGGEAVIAWSDRPPEVVDLGHGGQVRALEDPRATLFALDVSPDGRLAAGAVSAGVCLWRLEDGRLLHRWRTLGLHLSLTFSPDGRTLISGARVGGLFRFRLPPGPPAPEAA